MATITATDMTGSGEREITENTLTASDTFTFTESKNQILVIRNDTAGAITPNIDGDGASSDKDIPGGPLALDLSAGYTLGSIGIDEVFAIPLNSIKNYLVGTIAITGGDGAEASLLEF
jgi:hypothetical protein